MHLSFAEFTAKSYVDRSVFDRKEFDVVTNAVKWLAMRVSYGFYRLGLTANQVDGLGVLLSLAGFICLSTAGQVPMGWAPFLGLALLYFHVFLDFVDGPIAKAMDASSDVGAALDDIGADLDRLLMFALLGIFSESSYLVFATVAAGGILVMLVPATSPALQASATVSRFVGFFTGRFSLVNCRFMLAVLPLALVLVAAGGGDLRWVARAWVVFYTLAAAGWLLMCMPTRRGRAR